TQNILHPDKKQAVDYSAMPHAIFSSPQIAGVGKTEEELKEDGIPYTVARDEFKNTAMGEAMLDETGFAKFLIDPDTLKVHGCHIMGPEASILILVGLKSGDGTINDVLKTVHIHPALSEIVQRAAGSFE
ncbi:dihydrolipoamide dehydrogenase, partial [Patescibacteria group bacterium]